MPFHNKNYWALILGGSSGFGLASAKKLSSMGMNICLVHRDRRGSMAKIETEFAEIKKNSQFKAINTDALSDEGIEQIANELSSVMGTAGKLRLLMHSIAFGNLKLITPQKEILPNDLPRKLAEKINADPKVLENALQELFESGDPRLADAVKPVPYSQERFIDKEDMQNTIYSMGSSLKRS